MASRTPAQQERRRTRDRNRRLADDIAARAAGFRDAKQAVDVYRSRSDSGRGWNRKPTEKRGHSTAQIAAAYQLAVYGKYGAKRPPVDSLTGHKNRPRYKRKGIVQKWVVDYQGDFTDAEFEARYP